MVGSANCVYRAECLLRVCSLWAKYGGCCVFCPIANYYQSEYKWKRVENQDSLSHFYLFLFLFFLSFVFLGPHRRHMEVPRLGVKLELLLPTYTTAHGNAGSLTHWVRPGIKPATSWFLCGFVSTVPQWELPIFFFKYWHICNICFTKKTTNKELLG